MVKESNLLYCYSSNIVDSIMGLGQILLGALAGFTGGLYVAQNYEVFSIFLGKHHKHDPH
jgi:hypothetical protein